MAHTLTIHPRFCGPPESGNGGYVCGMLAKTVDYIAEVTLRKPPPLSTEMQILTDEGQVALMQEDKLMATVRPGTIEFSAPSAPDFESATEASKGYIGFKSHAYRTCFVCGPDRHSPDGLCIYPGRTADKSMLAAPWIPDTSLGDAEGKVKSEFIWSALDCPGGIVVMARVKLILLGRMTAEIRQPVEVGEKCVVIGWQKGEKGRKIFSGTALYSESRGLCAVAHSTWFNMDQPSI